MSRCVGPFPPFFFFSPLPLPTHTLSLSLPIQRQGPSSGPRVALQSRQAYAPRCRNGVRQSACARLVFWYAAPAEKQRSRARDAAPRNGPPKLNHVAARAPAMAPFAGHERRGGAALAGTAGLPVPAALAPQRRPQASCAGWHACGKLRACALGTAKVVVVVAYVMSVMFRPSKRRLEGHQRHGLCCCCRISRSLARVGSSGSRAAATSSSSLQAALLRLARRPAAPPGPATDHLLADAAPPLAVGQAGQCPDGSAVPNHPPRR